MSGKPTPWPVKFTSHALYYAFENYRRACYGSAPLPLDQLRETRQAFLSGIHWLNAQEDYEPGAVATALREILGADNPAIAAAPAKEAKAMNSDFDKIKAEVIRMRDYAMRKSVAIGDCAAWNRIKEYYGVGQRDQDDFEWLEKYEANQHGANPL